MTDDNFCIFEFMMYSQKFFCEQNLSIWGFSVSSGGALKISSCLRSLRRVLEIWQHGLKRPQMVTERTKIDFLRNHQFITF